MSDDCIWKPLCKMDHLFTEDSCDGCASKETKGGNSMNENRCVCCGAIIPEGSQVCVNCQKGAGVHKPTPEEKVESFVWDWFIPLLLLGFVVYCLFFARW